METIYLLSALIGGTFLACQFVMTVLGLASETGFAHDVPTDHHWGGDHHPGDSHSATSPETGTHEESWSTWIFGIISFRTVIAALAFFGMAGMAASSAGMDGVVTFLLAVAAGWTAMYGVHWLMRVLTRVRSDGTLRIQQALGEHGNVYVPIPASGEGIGKVQLRMQDRIVELKAVTPGKLRLSTGAMVVVTDIIGGDTVVVEPIPSEAPLNTPADARPSQSNVAPT